MDFIDIKIQQIEDEIVSRFIKWSLADKIERDPKSNRKSRVKARQDKRILDVELDKLRDRLKILEKY